MPPPVQQRQIEGRPTITRRQPSTPSTPSVIYPIVESSPTPPPVVPVIPPTTSTTPPQVIPVLPPLISTPLITPPPPLTTPFDNMSITQLKDSILKDTPLQRRGILRPPPSFIHSPPVIPVIPPPQGDLKTDDSNNIQNAKIDKDNKNLYLIGGAVIVAFLVVAMNKR